MTYRYCKGCGLGVFNRRRCPRCKAVLEDPTPYPKTRLQRSCVSTAGQWKDGKAND